VTQLYIGRLVALWLLVVSGYGHASEVPPACPELVDPVRDVMGVSFYTDVHHSIIDLRLLKDNNTRLKPISTFLRVVSQTTDRYVQGGGH
jgi:hypothetical protein